MKNTVLPFASSVPRIATLAAILLASHAVGCVAGPGDESAVDLEDEDLGEAQSALLGWDTTSYWSATNLNGVSIPSGYPNCALAGLQGNFNSGQSPTLGSQSLFSEAGIQSGKLHAHGGAHTDELNQRDWDGNPVGSMATCWNTASTVFAAARLWGGSSTGYGPQRIAALGTDRQCYLTHMEAGDNNFSSSTHYVQVKRYPTADGTHPSPGWYIEGNLNLNGSNVGWPTVRAICYDFTGLSELGTYTLTSTVGQYATLETSAGYQAGCGLTKVQGPFTNNSQSTGVWIAPEGAHWKMHAYGGQAVTAVCAQ
ncbi:MAG: hypothetical protein R3B70_19280 [Polyangiaceae bacterium]